VVRRLAWTFGLLLVLAIPLAPPAGGAPASGPAIMRLSEIRPGMRGVGRTVVSGQRPQDYAFEVMDVLQTGGGPVGVDRLIMVRVSGPLMERTGGTAAGMSGSPMYINGRLIGAHSAGFVWRVPSSDIALVTPIQDMLKVLDRRPAGAAAQPAIYHATRPFVLAGRRYGSVAVAPTAGAAARLAAQLPGVAVAAPAVAVYARGLSPRAYRLLSDLVEPRGFELLQGHGGRGDFAAEPIVAGSSIGIQDVRGDIEFGGICTVTIRVGDRILACGHPWENAGDVEYVMTASEVVTVVRALPRNFKIGNLGAIIGVIDQDRPGAIAGTLGRYPRLFNLRVVVTDQDAGTRTEVGAQLVRRRDMARLFAPLVALSAVERARNQAGGEGTAITKLTLRARGLPRPIVRENTFFSTQDVATASVLDIVDAMELAFYNDLRVLEPVDLTVEVVLTKKRNTASIVEVQTDAREVTPGGTLRVRVALQPYLAERPEVRVVEVPVPRDFPRGPAFLVVRSAGVDAPNVPVQAQLGQTLAVEPTPWGVDSLETALRLFENFAKNTDLLVRIQPFGLPATGQDFTRFDVPAARTARTEWVIQGVERLPILIR
jgi:hypothetical protein